MSSLSTSVSARYPFRKRCSPYSGTRRVPALSTQEAAAVVLGIIEARLEDGWTLDQIGWQRFCRDGAVVHVVTEQLAHGTQMTQEVSL